MKLMWGGGQRRHRKWLLKSRAEARKQRHEGALEEKGHLREKIQTVQLTNITSTRSLNI